MDHDILEIELIRDRKKGEYSQGGRNTNDSFLDFLIDNGEKLLEEDRKRVNELERRLTEPFKH